MVAFPCAHLGVSRHRRARRPRPKKSGSRRQNTEDPFSFVLDICFATTAAPRRAFFGRLDFSFLVSDVRSLGLADATA